MSIFSKNKKGPARNAYSIAVAGGFTLIELLVVVAIISLLASIVFASLQTSRVKARNAKRKADLHQIANAIYLYMSDNNFAVPGDNGGVDSDSYPSWGSQAPGNPITNLVPQYIASLPVDPVNDGTYNYSYEPGDAGIGGVWYNSCIQAKLETAGTYIVVGFGPTIPVDATHDTGQGYNNGYQCNSGAFVN